MSSHRGEGARVNAGQPSSAQRESGVSCPAAASDLAATRSSLVRRNHGRQCANVVEVVVKTPHAEVQQRRRLFAADVGGLAGLCVSGRPSLDVVVESGREAIPRPVRRSGACSLGTCGAWTDGVDRRACRQAKRRRGDRPAGGSRTAAGALPARRARTRVSRQGRRRASAYVDAAGCGHARGRPEDASSDGKRASGSSETPRRRRRRNQLGTAATSARLGLEVLLVAG